MIQPNGVHGRLLREIGGFAGAAKISATNTVGEARPSQAIIRHTLIWVKDDIPTIMAISVVLCVTAKQAAQCLQGVIRVVTWIKRVSSAFRSCPITDIALSTGQS